MSQHSWIGKSFEEVKAIHLRPYLKELSSREGVRSFMIMETQCTCDICESGRDCLVGFCADVVDVDSDGIVIRVIEER